MRGSRKEVVQAIVIEKSPNCRRRKKRIEVSSRLKEDVSPVQVACLSSPSTHAPGKNVTRSGLETENGDLDAVWRDWPITSSMASE